MLGEQYEEAVRDYEKVSTVVTTSPHSVMGNGCLEVPVVN